MGNVDQPCTTPRLSKACCKPPQAAASGSANSRQQLQAATGGVQQGRASPHPGVSADVHQSWACQLLLDRLSPCMGCSRLQTRPSV